MGEPDPAQQAAALAEIAADPRLAPIFDYWCKKAGDRPLPGPRDIDPVDLLTAVLPYLTLLDVIDGGRTFRVRLVGTASVAAAGADHTGRYLDESIAGDVLEAALRRYRTAVAHHRPVLGIAEYSTPDGSSIRNLLLTLPLSSDGLVVDRILGVYSPRSEWLTRQSLRYGDVGDQIRVTRTQTIL